MDTVELQQRITEMLDRLAAVKRVGGTILIPASHCPYCSRPEGWDACPAHRDGAPPTPPPTPHAQS